MQLILTLVRFNFKMQVKYRVDHLEGQIDSGFDPKLQPGSAKSAGRRAENGSEKDPQGTLRLPGGLRP
jgi:hypothetical protein